MSKNCLNCGTGNIDEAKFCSSCGNKFANVSTNNISSTFDATVPHGVAGWSWGAFFIAPIWAIGNKTWIGLFALIPYIGIIVAIILGIKGREWAWKNNHWDSLEHFNRVQRRWSIWGALVPVLIIFGILAAVAIPKLATASKDAEIANEADSEDSPYEAITTNDNYSVKTTVDTASAPIENNNGQFDSDCAYGTLAYNTDGTTTCVE